MRKAENHPQEPRLLKCRSSDTGKVSAQKMHRLGKGGSPILFCMNLLYEAHIWGCLSVLPVTYKIYILPSSAQAPAPARLSLALILVSPHPPTRESRQTWNLASVGIPEVA